jgi:hypothetical protein
MRRSRPFFNLASGAFFALALLAQPALALAAPAGGFIPAVDPVPQSNSATEKPPANGFPTETNPATQGYSNETNVGNSTSGQTLVNPLKFNSLEELIDAILSAVIKLGTYVLVLMLMWTGFKFVAARGNEEAIRSARTALMWTIIGGLILLGAKAIELVIQATVTSITP